MRTKWTIVLLVQAVAGAGKWGYNADNGPEKWGGLCQTGTSQSPINIIAKSAKYKTFEPFELNHYDVAPWVMNLENNGHTAKMTMQAKTNHTPHFTGGGFTDEFEFAQMHFHWGKDMMEGSEHLKNGEAFPLEVHLVHYNTKYPDIGTAASEPDGLAVLGVFFKESYEDVAEWDDMMDALSVVTVYGRKKTLAKPMKLSSFLPKNVDKFYRYSGSLTTPTCAETVTWTVFDYPLSISRQQMQRFLALRTDTGDQILKNYRPTQPLYNRTLYVSKVYEGLHDVYKEKPQEIDHFFLLIMSIIIFFMQCGFAFMEAGAVRSKNTVNILIKNWLDMCIGALVYWAVGFALTFGKTYPATQFLFGSSYFFFIDMPAYKLSKWFFQFVFAATAATLVSGSLAERCNFVAYCVYSVMITGFIYPIIAHWAWHQEGWLRINGFFDFAGSGVVHLTGAVCALVGCILMGPRAGRFDKDGKPVNMPGHSVPLSALGGLILIFGFFACNGTKQGSISHPGDGVAIATAVVNTALGTSAAGLSTLIVNKFGIIPGTGHNYSFLVTMNGALTGTVALCAGCNVFASWAAVLTGILAGPFFLISKWILIHVQIDDPLDAIPVHGAGGVLGLFSAHIFRIPDGIIFSWSSKAFTLFAWNLIGMVTIIAWTGSTCFLMFYVLKKLRLLRVEAEHEFKGMDLLKHGESAYPADAWVEQQYMAMDSGSTPNLFEDLSNEEHHHHHGPKTRDGLPPNMKFSRTASYNNPNEMFPSASKLFAGMNNIAKTAADTHHQAHHTNGSNGKKISTISGMQKVEEEGTEEEKEELNKEELNKEELNK